MSCEWSSLPLYDVAKKGVRTVEREDLLGEGLVLREVESVGAGARVGLAEEVQERRDVHVHRVVAGVGLGEVEDEVGLGAGDGDEGLVAPVEDLVDGLVAELDERVEDLLAIRNVFLLLAPDLPLRLRFRRLLRRRRGGLGVFLVDVVQDGDLEFFPAHALPSRLTSARTCRASGSSWRAPWRTR